MANEAILKIYLSKSSSFLTNYELGAQVAMVERVKAVTCLVYNRRILQRLDMVGKN